MGAELRDIQSGAKFYRADLHIHSFGGSWDVTDNDATPEKIVEQAKLNNIHIIAIADHNSIINIRRAVEAGKEHDILVIPAVELSTVQGHFLCYTETVEKLEKFYHSLTIHDFGTQNSRCQESMADCLSKLNIVGGFGIIAHIETKGSFEEVCRTNKSKEDIICHPELLGIEVKKADCDVKYNMDDVDDGRKALVKLRSQKIGRPIARVLNSDAHALKAVGKGGVTNQKITRYKMNNPTFFGLKLALQEADTRVRIEDEIPSTISYIEGVKFTGGFLNEQIIHFNKNLTCIIGGRGSGKSTIFTALKLIKNDILQEDSVIDSDVWSDFITIYYKDETNYQHILGRNKFEEIHNLSDSDDGVVSFKIETYGQGETHDIVRDAQKDPLILMNFLDNLMSVENALNEEKKAIEALKKLSEDIKTSEVNVAKIEPYEKSLKLKTSQIERLKLERGEEVIALQQELERNRNIRNQILARINGLKQYISQNSAIDVTKNIQNIILPLVQNNNIASSIKDETTSYEASVSHFVDNLSNQTDNYVKEMVSMIDKWGNDDAILLEKIEKKKNELLKAGIHLDMPFIQQLIKDVATLENNLSILKTWIPHLESQKEEYQKLLTTRWSFRDNVSTIRKDFAKKINASLLGSSNDLFINLKYDKSSFSSEACDLLNEIMGWRAKNKARTLVSKLTVIELLDCVDSKDIQKITRLQDENNETIFNNNDANVLLDKLAESKNRVSLETAVICDLPRLTVTKKPQNADGSSRASYQSREFSRLSLGQQQSVILAIMLVSDSNAPLIIDQPEDNLDGEFIYKTLVPAIRKAKERRQVIIITHNPNIAVLTDAEQIIVLKATNDKASIMSRGSIDEEETREMTCSILEGAKEAFSKRAIMYNIKN